MTANRTGVSLPHAVNSKDLNTNIKCVESKCGSLCLPQLSVTPSVWMEEPALSPTSVPVPAASMALSVKSVRLWLKLITVTHFTALLFYLREESYRKYESRFSYYWSFLFKLWYHQSTESLIWWRSLSDRSCMKTVNLVLDVELFLVTPSLVK